MSMKLAIFLGVIMGLMVGIPLGVTTIDQMKANATGCPTQFVNEHIDNALKAFDEKNPEELKNQLELAKEALGIAASENE